VDINATILERVMAAEDGVIESVRNDSLMGITVVIDHLNGVKTVYSNLSSMDMVTEGELVKKGEVINGAGDTALIETGQETHIHFEMIVDGKYVNPKDYII
jgi:murein DD-endopeptidase MepM/ murein hydrolase activator NlpD